MKRLIALLLLLLITPLTGCGRPDAQAGEKISVVCTIFPPYDWVRRILGDRADEVALTLLMDGTADLHSYQPSVADIAAISGCDLFFYIGGESDAWVGDVLAEAKNPDILAVCLLDALGSAAKTEEIAEGMEEEETHSGDEAHGEEEAVPDEHIWLSLKNASALCPVIADALAAVDAAHTGEYKDNLDAYTRELSALDGKYRSAVGAAPTKTLLFGDRFPFRYLTDDYGLQYYAAFPGCSAETEASFETVLFLAEKTGELGLKYILVTESSDQSIAGTIRDNTAGSVPEILVMNAMQSVSFGDMEDGATYLSMMESNLSALKQALS